MDRVVGRQQMPAPLLDLGDASQPRLGALVAVLALGASCD